MSAKGVPLLVTTHWLRKKLSEAPNNLVVLDTLWVPLGDSYKKYKTAKHIPGAGHFDIKKDVVSTQHIPRNLPEPQAFQDYAQSLGINKDSHVILYDRDDANDLMSYTLASARVWWLFRIMGHQMVSVMDGGFVKWQKDGYDVTEEEVLPKAKGNFEHSFSQESLFSYEKVIASVKEGGTQIVDTRLHANFSGQEEEPCPFTQLAQQDAEVPVVAAEKINAGHMPGARNIPFPDLFSTETNCLKTPETLRKYAGVFLDKPLTTTCYIGHSACTMALAAALCGQLDVNVYYGSWTEFGQRAPAHLCVKK